MTIRKRSRRSGEPPAPTRRLVLVTGAARLDQALADEIATRATRLVHSLGGPAGIARDLLLVHVNGCPLRLSDLLTASEFNLLHDILGIRMHLNSDTGQLEHGFWPRYGR